MPRATARYCFIVCVATPLCLAIIDIDHFKQINDSYGHHAGDQVLQALGRLLGNDSRKGDIVCRQGGDEFCLILPRLALATAEARARQWQTEFGGSHFDFLDSSEPITLSIGIACVEGKAGSCDSVFIAADKALYLAKEEGRNRICIASDSSARQSVR